MKIQIEITNTIDLLPNWEHTNNSKYFIFNGKILLFKVFIKLLKYKGWRRH